MSEHNTVFLEGKLRQIRKTVHAQTASWLWIAPFEDRRWNFWQPLGEESSVGEWSIANVGNTGLGAGKQLQSVVLASRWTHNDEKNLFSCAPLFPVFGKTVLQFPASHEDRMPWRLDPPVCVSFHWPSLLIKTNGIPWQGVISWILVLLVPWRCFCTENFVHTRDNPNRMGGEHERCRGATLWKRTLVAHQRNYWLWNYVPLFPNIVVNSSHMLLMGFSPNYWNLRDDRTFVDSCMFCFCGFVKWKQQWDGNTFWICLKSCKRSDVHKAQRNEPADYTDCSVTFELFEVVWKGNLERQFGLFSTVDTAQWHLYPLSKQEALHNAHALRLLCWFILALRKSFI